ncbi:DUF935 family protein [Acetobacter tropicalis]|uniref:Mu-like prophage FluMu protein gp29 n=1 Tax=Acetobacter tropicalis TaxID=104102 RepID=A0A095B5R5_9PROT|nr:DUF935 family protein [Acetobacter tropicalis]KAA8387882.1 DUF935 family protein [Acetobacter tropicalis]KAA8388795.1 DUF935 family protein [Acetobacter tropicalis]KGB24278.1 Mu-like prophage FluMu protein gp29 [Acetobacter tropicalis]MDO8172367.1 DUF935 family protein [Acetobacter tropicalis]
MALLDHTGKPFPSWMLQGKPVGGANLTGSRSAITTMSMEWVDPAAVGEMLRSASQGNSQAWQEFCELIEQKDLHYLGVLSTRKRTVSQLPITVEDAGPSPDQKKQSEFVRDWIAKGVLQRSLFDMLDAIAKGFSVMALQWHLEAGNYWPDNLIWRPQRWFDISYQDGETIMLRDDVGSGVTPDMAGAVPEMGFSGILERSAVIHRHQSWSGLTIDQGLTRAIAFNSLFKLFSNRDWGVFVQAFGIPIRVGKFGRDSTDDDRATLWQAIVSSAGQLGIMIPESMMLEFVEPKNGAGSNDVHERRCKWLDEQTSKAVLGQTGTTDARQGTHAAAAVHRQVQDDIERADAMLVGHTVNQQIVRHMIDMSFGAPKDGNYPVVRIGRPDEAPLADVISAVQNLGPQGFKVRADDLYGRLNLQPPEEGDVVVGMIAQPQVPQPASDQPAQVKPPKQLPSRDPVPTVHDPQADDQAQQTLAETTLHTRIGKLVSLHVRDNGPLLIDMMTQSTARRANTALQNMRDQVREELEASSSLQDFERRLDVLDLDDDAFAQAMTEAVLVMELAGQAEVLEQVRNDG